MNSELSALFNRIKSNRDLLTASEAQTSQGIVLPLLNILGWNVFDTNEVTPEYTVAAKRVDFALRLNNQNKVFLEIKKTSENLDDHQEQLVYYAFQQGVKLAILTNGITWQFYLPLEEGSWEQRRFFTVDLLVQSDVDSVRRFVELLTRSAINDGTAYSNAKSLYEGRQKNKIIREALPKAWQRLVAEPDEMLVELLNETLEKISGYKAEENVVEEFLKNVHSGVIQSWAAPANLQNKPQKPVKGVSKPANSTIKSAGAEPHETKAILVSADAPKDLLHTRVLSATLGGVVLPNNWRSILHNGILIAIGKGFDIPSLESALRVNFRKGHHTEQGFGPIEGTEYSWQNQDANKTAANAVRLARLLKTDLEVSFEWREKGKYPKRLGLLHFST